MDSISDKLKNPENKCIAVAMSGGVDSSVAAALLKEQGYRVIGLTMHLWDYDGVGGNVAHESSCCSLDSIYDARHVCNQLDIPHYVLDVRKEFETHVIRNFISEYLNGRTPNPCVLCNSLMKWHVLLQKARQLEAEYLATGHYAQIQFDEVVGRYRLLQGVDDQKDQAYALWGLTQPQLAGTILPLGMYTKKDVRRLAAEFGLKTVQKNESQEICFIPDNNYRRFLAEREPDAIERLRQGEIVDTAGHVLGFHDGYPNFTIGQRRKLGIAVGRPMYVVRIDATNNRVIVGDPDELQQKALTAHRVNWIGIEPPASALEAVVRVRYNDRGQQARIFPLNTRTVRVEFHTPVKAITPGQSAVFYRDREVLGGGIIGAESVKDVMSGKRC